MAPTNQTKRWSCYASHFYLYRDARKGETPDTKDGSKLIQSEVFCMLKQQIL